ncbi:MAG: BMP family ABC transporter substrate-binding protein, partial [Alphaproteobacteria bacterium]|nr:BMP family ABC transporter substrate-binding protein [Alphaproteobacteria bacterium]
IRNLARRGASVVIAVGFNNHAAIETVAKEFPNVKFTIIDSVVDLPNVQSVTFREHEGSFLVGMAAALTSKTGKVGFVGGMDVPIIRKFYKGYEEGAKYAKPSAEVFMNMTGTTPTAFRDPTRGAELARGQFDRGVDVVFAAAGATGTGVYQAAKDAGKFAIGVDSNQNHLHPGTMLTSMVKRVDVAVYEAMTQARAGSWKPGARALGLKEEGVGVAIDDNNKALLSADVLKRIDEARQAIIDGKIVVTDVMR